MANLEGTLLLGPKAKSGKMLTRFVSIKPKSDGRVGQSVGQSVNSGCQAPVRALLERPKKLKIIPCPGGLMI